MRLLVTGGAGFIGSNFVGYALDRGYDIINLDKLTYAGNPENLTNFKGHKRHRFVKGDIADGDAVRAVMDEHVDVVINFAAESHVDRSICDPSDFVKTNVLGAQVLLNAFLGIWQRRKDAAVPMKFIQVSTDEVYGSLGPRGYFTEETPLSPNNPYAACKAAADMLAASYHRTHGLPVIITRCSNNYGPRQYPEKLIPLVITNVLRELPVPVYGDGLYIRDWLHVEDHCRALEMMIAKGEPGETYNIGGNNEITNIELVKTIVRILGKSQGLINYVQDRPGHDRRYAIDAGKISKSLGWRPQIAFEEGLARTVDWYRTNEKWWHDLINNN